MIGGDGINDESSKTSPASSHAQKQDAGGDEAHGGRGSRDSVVDRKLKTLVPNHPHMGFYLHAHDGLVPTTPDSSPTRIPGESTADTHYNHGRCRH